MPINPPGSQPTAPARRSPNKPAPVPVISKTEIMSGRAEAVNGLFELGAAGLLLTKQYADAQAVSDHSENISVEVAKIANDNEKVAGLIDKLTSVGPYAGLITAVLPLAMQLAVNHKRMEPGAMGTLPPAALEAKVKAEMAEKKAAFLREASAAQERANEAEANLRKAEAA